MLNIIKERKIPGTIQLDKAIEHPHLKLLLTPVGRECVPECLDRHEMIKAITQVLTVLHLLHKDKICHCDVRWPNVIFDITTNKYVLIDFEYSRLSGSACPSIRTRFMSKWITRNNKWDETGDTWQVAQMVKRWMDAHDDNHAQSVVETLIKEENWGAKHLLDKLNHVWRSYSTAATACDKTSM